jgi:CMP-N-acetylneuraminic acid synthetase
MLNKTFTCIIPARGGSKRIPNKNIRDICGKPLVAWTIDTAFESMIFQSIWVNSDDELILNVAANHGAFTYKRPPELATDESSTECVIMEQLEVMNNPTDYVMVLQPTSPTRTVESVLWVAMDYVNSKDKNLLATVNTDGKRNGSIFIASWKYMLNTKKWKDESTWLYPCIDIDTEDDWKEAECLLKTRES